MNQADTVVVLGLFERENDEGLMTLTATDMQKHPGLLAVVVCCELCLKLMIYDTRVETYPGCWLNTPFGLKYKEPLSLLQKKNVVFFTAVILLL